MASWCGFFFFAEIFGAIRGIHGACRSNWSCALRGVFRQPTAHGGGDPNRPFQRPPRGLRKKRGKNTTRSYIISVLILPTGKAHRGPGGPSIRRHDWPVSVGLSRPGDLLQGSRDDHRHPGGARQWGIFGFGAPRARKSWALRRQFCRGIYRRVSGTGGGRTKLGGDGGEGPRSRRNPGQVLRKGFAI